LPADSARRGSPLDVSRLEVRVTSSGDPSGADRLRDVEVTVVDADSPHP
jgi:hypothetical protein